MTLFILGESWDREDAACGMPFQGYGGRILRQYLSRVGIRFEDCYATCVFNRKPSPENNDVKNFLGPKSNAVAGYPALLSGKYVQQEFAGELERLQRELATVKPTMVLALGATACWALGVGTQLKKIRGAATMSRYGKVFPTINPSSIFRDWSLKPVFLSDLEKVVVEKDFPEVRRPVREIWVEPTIEDLYEFEARYFTPQTQLSTDIETHGDYITCIGFAPTPQVGLVVPFIRHDGTHYWKTTEETIAAWKFTKRVCSQYKLLGQNFLYDCHRLWRSYGIPTPRIQDDTMLLHHSIFIELEKGLGFLGSVYTNEARWKYMRAADTLKREDE